MFKIIVSLLLVASTLSALSFEEQKEIIQKANKSLQGQGSTMTMYHFDANDKDKIYEYGYSVDSLTLDNSKIQTITDSACANSNTRKSINKGWTFKYDYRNKITLKKVISFQVDKDSCANNELMGAIVESDEGTTETSIKSVVMKGALIGGALMIGGLILVLLLTIIQKIFSLGKNKINLTKNKIASVVSNDVAPYMAEKKYEIERDLMEKKMLKLKNLLDNEIITNEEYRERIDKLRSDFSKES